MTELSSYHTPAKLLKALTKDQIRPPSKDEIFEQRVSFVYGSMKVDSGVTRTQIIKILSDETGTTGDSL